MDFRLYESIWYDNYILDLPHKQFLRTFGESGSYLSSYCKCRWIYNYMLLIFCQSWSQHIVPNVKCQYCRVQAWEHVHRTGSSIVLACSSSLACLSLGIFQVRIWEKPQFWSERQLKLKQVKFCSDKLMNVWTLKHAKD